MLSLSFGNGFIGLSSSEIAVSGSFNPLPVKIATTFYLEVIYLVLCNLIKPAIEALLAGSLKTPSLVVIN